MRAIKRIKQWWRHLRGDWIDEIMGEIRANGVETRKHINNVYLKAQLDGENDWFKRERIKNDGKTNP